MANGLAFELARQFTRPWAEIICHTAQNARSSIVWLDTAKSLPQLMPLMSE